MKWDSDNVSAPHTQRELGEIPQDSRSPATPEAGDLVSRAAAIKATVHLLRDGVISGDAEGYVSAALKALPAAAQGQEGAGPDAASIMAIVMDECWKDREMKLAVRIESRIRALRAQSAHTCKECHCSDCDPNGVGHYRG